MMKRILSMLMVLMLLVSVVGCSSTSTPKTPEEKPVEGQLEETGKLVVYSAFNATFLNNAIPMFEKETGIEVELVQAGTGELLERIRAEKDNPGGDIYLAGMTDSSQVPNLDLWDEYVSPHDFELPEKYRNIHNKITCWSLEGSILMVNTDLIGDIPTNSYADLLNPKLAGKIAFPDPSLTSCGFEHLTNILYAIGKPEDDFAEGWEYVDKLLDNATVIGSSSSIIKGVVNGEYVVGPVYENGPVEYIAAGADNLRIDYMDEGVIFQINGVSIIKDCKNRLSAEKFVDFLISKDFQEYQVGPPINKRSVREVSNSSDIIPDLKDINTIDDDGKYVAEHKKEWLAKFQEILTSKK